MLNKLRDRLRQRLGRHSPLKLVVVSLLLGLFAGITALATTTAGLAWTNREAFCIGCHEMRENVYAEFKGTIHDTNRSGVRATCPDCHVPHEFFPLIKRKIQASGELYGAFTGKLATKEKFEAHRYEMAKSVWKGMQANDSRECRNCHSREAMSKELQSKKAQARHAKGVAENKTCVDCHFGIAHKEPDGPGPQEMSAKAAPQAPVDAKPEAAAAAATAASGAPPKP
jgi:cytochrome c-type protein NapC